MSIIDSDVLNSLSVDDLKALMAQAASADPGAFASFLKENDDAQRAVAAMRPARGAPRAPSFLKTALEIGLVAMSDEFDVASDLKAVLQHIVECIREKKDGTGTQEACTLSFDDNGVSHRVRFTIMSETAAADSVLAKALSTINEAGEESFGAAVDKWRKSIKRQRVDASVRDSALEEFNTAVDARRAIVEATNPPPAPPA